MLLKLKRLLDIDQWETLAEIGNQTEQDFIVEIDSREYRFIHTDIINDVFHQECMETIQECYELSDIPSFIEIDWKATTGNCLIDGYGHQFSAYDGNEIECGDWHIFRIN